MLPPRLRVPTGITTTVAGWNPYSDGFGTAASFLKLASICADSLGNFFVVDGTYRTVVRTVNSAGIFSML